MEENTMLYWTAFIVIGWLTGWMMRKITRRRGLGLVGDTTSGICGAMLGGLLGIITVLHADSPHGVCLLALAGAVVIVGTTRWVKRLASGTRWRGDSGHSQPGESVATRVLPTP